MVCSSESIPRVLKDSKLSRSKANEVVLLGGSSRIPKVQEMLSEVFDSKEPNKSINPDGAVVYEATVLRADRISGKHKSEKKLQDLLVLVM